MAMNSTRRKLAIATWSAPSEGNIYGKLTMDAEEAMAFLADKSRMMVARDCLNCRQATSHMPIPGARGTVRGSEHEHWVVRVAKHYGWPYHFLLATTCTPHLLHHSLQGNLAQPGSHWAQLVHALLR